MPTMIAMLLGYIFFMPRNGKLPEKATFFLMFVSILFAAQFRSKRFAEYFPPFAVLFFGFSLQAFRRTMTLMGDRTDDVNAFKNGDEKNALFPKNGSNLHVLPAANGAQTVRTNRRSRDVRRP